MGKTFRRNDEDFDTYHIKESRKEAKAKKRKAREHEEWSTHEERHG